MPAPPVYTTRRLVLVLAVVVLISELAPLELTLVYPGIRYMVPVFRTPDIGWVLTVVSIAGLATMPMTCRLADRYGRRNAYLALAVLFAVGALVCATTTSFAVLLVGRALQGAAMAVTPITYGLIRDIFPRDRVPLALGVAGGGAGLSTLAGPFVGGSLVDHYGYHGIFWFCLVYAVALIPALALVVPQARRAGRTSLDVPGAVLIGAGAALVLLGVGQGATWGWGSPRIVGSFVCGAVLLAAFALWERHAAHPMVDVRLLASPALTTTLLAAFLGSFVLSGYALMLPQMLQTPRLPHLGYGFGLSATGVATLTMSAGIMVLIAGPTAGWVARRFGPRTGLVVALLSATASVVLLSGWHTQRWQITVAAGLLGLGNGFLYTSLANLVVDAVPAPQTTISSSMLSTASNLGAAAGVTAVTAVLTQNIHLVTRTHAVVYSDLGFTQGFRLAAATGVVAVAVALLMRHGRTSAGTPMPD